MKNIYIFLPLPFGLLDPCFSCLICFYLARVAEYFDENGRKEDADGLEQVAENVDEGCADVDVLL